MCSKVGGAIVHSHWYKGGGDLVWPSYCNIMQKYYAILSFCSGVNQEAVEYQSGGVEVELIVQRVVVILFSQFV